MFCQVCKKEIDTNYLGIHLGSEHKMSFKEYHDQFPSERFISEELEKSWDKVTPVSYTDIEIKAKIAGISFPLYDVPEEHCMPAPDNYKVPVTGKLGQEVKNVLIAIKNNRSCLIHGPAGTGKDSIFHFVSAYTRRPGLVLSIKPGTDIRAWFFSKEFDHNGTRWEEGPLLKALVEGYDFNGKKIPYMILLSDFDRADRGQAEYMRLIMDSIQGRVEGPQGRVFKVLPGTLICATANSAGGGDTTGRYASSNVMDASIIDRFQRVFCFEEFIPWIEEQDILKDKFPFLFKEKPEFISIIGKATQLLRDAIQQNEIYGELSHRGICSMCSFAEDLLVEGYSKPTTMLAEEAIRSWTNKLPDKETREQALTIVNSVVQTVRKS